MPFAPRPVGRPRKEIDLASVADIAGELFAQGGYDAVSIEAVAERLAVSRATLYRTVASKEDLLAILFERSTQRLEASVEELLSEGHEPHDELQRLVQLHTASAVETRRYMAVFFGGAGLPSDMLERWRQFTRRYEKLWETAVGRAMAAGVMPSADPVLTTRLVLGMLTWVSRWYRPDEGYSTERIADTALSLLGIGTASPEEE